MRTLSDRIAALASPAFIAALASLALNDFVFKPAFHNALTGKLSDFAGLFALTLFAAILWPQKRLLAACSIAVAFSFWKTSYAEPVIDWLNSWSPVALGRTVDLTDLVAVPMVALAVWAAPRTKPWPAPKLFQLSLAAFAVFAFTATSRQRYVVRSTFDVTQARSIDETALQGLFDAIAAENGLVCVMCAPFSEGRVYVADPVTDVRALIVNLAESGTLYFTATGWDRPRGVRGLDRTIRAAVEDRFPDATVVDTTKAWISVADADTTIFVIRPSDGARAAERTVESIVANATGGQRLDRDGRARGIEIDAHTPNRLSRRGVLIVRVTRWNNRPDLPYRAVTEEIAGQLAAEFGEENVVRHVTPAQVEWIY